MVRRIAFSLVALLITVSISRAADGLKAGDNVAIIGDSITEQKLYSVYMEEYLLMCKPAADLKTCQFGWSGETSWGFLARMNNDMSWFHPTVATTCYGMNDGGYSPQTPDKAKKYRDSQKAIVQQMKKMGVRLIVVGSPGCVDADTFHKSTDAAVMYNKTLASERDLAKEVAQEEGVVFADVYDAMFDAMTKSKAKLGSNYAFAGGDGVHPGPNGQLAMAYAFLKALGCDGNIGTITIDLSANKAEASEGHKVLSFADGAVEIESSRYPFCFYGDVAGQSTRSAIEFLPFNEDLNRFKLVVKGAKGDEVKVKWGEAEKTFSKADLEKGINLAAEFVENPFNGPFMKVQQAIQAQQNLETPLHKVWIHNLQPIREQLPEAKEDTDGIIAAGAKRRQKLADAASAAVVPVKHTIRIEAK
jgi:lysophospholipase L1-like esterase